MAPSHIALSSRHRWYHLIAKWFSNKLSFSHQHIWNLVFNCNYYCQLSVQFIRLIRESYITLVLWNRLFYYDIHKLISASKIFYNNFYTAQNILVHGYFSVSLLAVKTMLTSPTEKRNRTAKLWHRFWNSQFPSFLSWESHIKSCEHSKLFYTNVLNTTCASPNIACLNVLLSPNIWSNLKSTDSYVSHSFVGRISISMLFLLFTFWKLYQFAFLSNN